MKKVFLFLGVFLLVLSFSGVASATYITNSWEDYDNVGYYLYEGDTDYYYGLNIAVADDFRPGIDYVTSAYLTFYLDDDYRDGRYEREYGWLYNGDFWTPTGEIDDGDEFFRLVWYNGLSNLNYDGSITVGVYSSYGDFKWSGAKVTAYGKSPVPEPGTIVLMGLGLVGLAGIGRRKLFKK